MYVSKLAVIWRARPFLAAGAAAAALAVTIAAAMMLPRAYQASSSVIMLAPRSASRMSGGNPYLSFSPSLTLTADAVAATMTAPSTARALAKQGFGAAYTVALAPYTTTTTGSVLVVTVKGSAKSAVRATLRGVTAEVGAKLAQLQSGVTRRHRITEVTLSYPLAPSLDVSQTGRSLIIVIVPVLLLGLAIPVLIDGQIARRRGGLYPAHRQVTAAD